MKKTAFETHWEDRARIDHAAWQRILTSLPLNAYKKSGPAQTRDFVEAVLGVAMAHAPWSHIPVGSVSPHSTMVRFHRWLEADLWDQVIPMLDEMPDALVALQALMRRHWSRKHMVIRDRAAIIISAPPALAAGPATACTMAAPQASADGKGDDWPRGHWPEAFGL